MPNRLFKGKDITLRMVINRTGTEVLVERPDGTATENKYGKVSDPDVSYSVVGNEMCRRIYGSNDARTFERNVQGGRVDSENPRLMFFKGADVREDDRATFPDTLNTYQIDQQVYRDTHDEYRVTLVT